MPHHRRAILDVDRIKNGALNQALETIRNRIDQFGVTEPLLQRQGKTQIVIQLPGVKDPKRAKALIQDTALLEFKMLDEANAPKLLLPVQVERSDEQTIREKFSGQIPESIGNLTNLRSLDLRNNEFSGPIPESLFNLSSLDTLYLADNNFSTISYALHRTGYESSNLFMNHMLNPLIFLMKQVGILFPLFIMLLFTSIYLLKKGVGIRE